MPPAPANRARLGLEPLEGRALPAAGVYSALPADTPSVQRVAAPAPAAAVRYSVVTIKNATAAPVTYRLDWGGVVVTATIPPGKSRVHFTNPSGKTALIQYDWNYAAGYQSQKYDLDSKMFVGTAATTPQAKDGMLYTFRPAGTVGIQLYA